MLEQKALAYVNMYGVLGALENLCELDLQAKEILKDIKKRVAVCFCVKDGPVCTFEFTDKGRKMTEGDKGCNCKMSFASPEKFNALINHSKIGMPTRGIITVLSFLAGPFSRLTDRLSEVLRPDEKAMQDKVFFRLNTMNSMYVIMRATCALANHDSISRQSAEYTVDGDISLGIKDVMSVTVNVKNHIFTAIKKPCKKPRAVMEFADLELANGLFNGKVATINEMCKGNIRLSGMISMLDNVNRILDRVAIYLQ